MMPEKYWCDFFGLNLERLAEAGLKVVAHRELEGYNGAWIFKLDQSVIISVPEEIIARVEAKAKICKQLDNVFSRDFAEQIFENIERTIGPCYQGYCTEKILNIVDESQVRLLAPDEYSLLEKLQQQVGEEAWDHSSIAKDKTNFGYFENGEIIAASCLEMWNENVANIGLLTLPAHHGKGCAKKLCAFSTRFGLSRGYEMVYQTLQSNLAAVAVARATGYIEYANHLAVRFKSA